ncbi:hypothetical protein D3C85_1099550 [compost metagenome]
MAAERPRWQGEFRQPAPGFGTVDGMAQQPLELAAGEDRQLVAIAFAQCIQVIAAATATAGVPVVAEVQLQAG